MYTMHPHPHAWYLMYMYPVYSTHMEDMYPACMVPTPYIL